MNSTKLYMLTMLFFISIGLQAQTINDGLRYSRNDIVGSARFVGMSGAFSSLGGDLSAVGQNPAGAATFTTNRFTTTFAFFDVENTSNYFESLHHNNYSSFNDNLIGFDQIGAIWVYQSDVSDWNKFVFSVNYNKEASYGENFAVKGVNTLGNSAVDYFLQNANGTVKDDIDVHTDETKRDVYSWLGENIGFGAQQAFLAYQSYVINPVDDTDPNNTQYTSNADYTNVKHNNSLATSGNKSRFDITFAGTYKKKLQLGISLSTYSIDFTENNRLIENGYSASSDLQMLKYRNNLRVEGSGIGLKFGAIYKPVKNVRLGLSFHTPEWLTINEFLMQSIHTEMGNGDSFDISPNIENVFAPYKVISPSKIIVGGSIVVNKKALLSVDYSYQNFANMHFKEEDYSMDSAFFDDVNDEISNTFTAVHKINIGAETKFDLLSLRGGVFASTSPYKDNKDLNATKGFTLGAGYSFGNVILDFSFMSSSEKFQHRILTLSDYAIVDINNNRYNIGLRYNF